MRIRIILILCTLSWNLFAQLPQTQIYYLPMKYQKKSGKFSFGTPQRISKKKGYNNQPSFTPDSKNVLYVTFIDSTNTDIVSYSLKQKTLTQITTDTMNVYSPIVTPDGKWISCVYGPAQQLWKYPLGGGNPKAVIKQFDSIGYYCWMNENTIASFVLPSPFSLYAHSLLNDTNIAFGLNIGRCLQPLKNENTVFYVKKKDSASAFICALQLSNDAPPQFYTITKTLPAQEDFAIMNDGTILMFSEKKLYKYNILKDRKWQFVTEFNDVPVDGFYRLSIAPNQKALAVVGYKGKKP